MYRKKDPKNKNITVRVNQCQHREFNEIAHSHDLSVSEWANHILSMHKYDFDERTSLEELILHREIEQSKLELVKRILEKFHINNEKSGNNKSNLFLNQLRIAIKILDMTSFKSDDVIDELLLKYHCSVKCSVHRSLI